MTSRIRFLICSTTAVAIFSAPARGADESYLAQTSGCLACHAGTETKMGPAYREVALKYAGKTDAEAILAGHIMKGTGLSGVGWNAAGKASAPFMPPNPGVSRKDAEKLARWILTVRGEICDPSKFVTDALAVSGAVEHPLTLKVGDLQKLPLYQLDAPQIVCKSGEKRGQLGSLKGVLLKDIVGKAVIVAPGHNDIKSMVVIVSASDGYKAVFSWAELFNSSIGDGVMVFFEQDGKPLDDHSGRIALISARDTCTGPRYVKWLKSIEVRKIE